MQFVVVVFTDIEAIQLHENNKKLNSKILFGLWQQNAEYDGH